MKVINLVFLFLLFELASLQPTLVGYDYVVDLSYLLDQLGFVYVTKYFYLYYNVRVPNLELGIVCDIGHNLPTPGGWCSFGMHFIFILSIHFKSGISETGQMVGTFNSQAEQSDAVIATSDLDIGDFVIRGRSGPGKFEFSTHFNLLFCSRQLSRFSCLPRHYNRWKL